MKKIVLKNKKLLVTHVIICAIAALIQVGVALVYSLITEVAILDLSPGTSAGRTTGAVRTTFLIVMFDETSAIGIT